MQHAEALLRASEAKGRSLSFAFVVPTWELLPFHVQVAARVRVGVGVGVGVVGLGLGLGLAVGVQRHPLHVQLLRSSWRR